MNGTFKTRRQRAEDSVKTHARLIRAGEYPFEHIPVEERETSAIERETGVDGWLDTLTARLPPELGETTVVKCDRCGAEVTTVPEQRGYTCPEGHEIVVDWFQDDRGHWEVSWRTVGNKTLFASTVSVHGGWGKDD